MKVINLKVLALLVLLVGSLRSQIIDFPQAIPVGDPNVVTTVTLRTVELKYVQPVNLPPIWVQPGSTVQLQLGDWAAGAVSYRWIRSTRSSIAGAASTFEIKAASKLHSDRYSCLVTDATGKVLRSEIISVLVGQPPPLGLAALSTLVRVTPQQPVVTVGFVVGENGKLADSSKTLLIRLLGPALSKYGVSDPLADPQVKIFDPKGTPLTVWATFTDPAKTLARLQESVGLSPLTGDTKDVVRLIALPPGGSTLQVSSESGGTGSVILEIYELP